MAILTEEALTFAKDHITNYYDSDFFPKAFEYDALWHSWGDVVRELTSKNVRKIPLMNSRAFPVLKPKGTFRVVHQLNPIETLIYTSLVYMVAPAIERARPKLDEKIACSYRISLKGGSFFSDGNGYSNFQERGRELAEKYKYVLTTDITDFYNQINLHRIQNAIEHSDPALSDVAGDIENFLLRLNSKISVGLPVGPAASIVLAEGVLIDIDQKIKKMGLEHTRYVDDFRVFSSSRKKLLEALENLTLYLYDSHRLTLSSEKTKIISSEVFLTEVLDNQYEVEKQEIMETLSMADSYGGVTEVKKVLKKKISERSTDELLITLESIKRRSYLDLGLARALIRKTRNSKNEKVAGEIIKNFEIFSPVINDFSLMLREFLYKDFFEKNKKNILRIFSSKWSQQKIVLHWLGWVASGSEVLLSRVEIIDFVFRRCNFEHQAMAAKNLRDLQFFREHKNRLSELSSWDKRALIGSSLAMPLDERKHWLLSKMNDLESKLDRWVAHWIWSKS